MFLDVSKLHEAAKYLPAPEQQMKNESRQCVTDLALVGFSHICCESCYKHDFARCVVLDDRPDTLARKPGQRTQILRT